MKISRRVLDEIIEHARQEAPIEACGYLAGENGRIAEAYAMKNIDGREDHFSFDPAEQFAVLKKARQSGFGITGVYHSHPESPARPSAEDVRLAYDPDLLYVIVSLEKKTSNIGAFRIRKGSVEEEPLKVEEENDRN